MISKIIQNFATAALLCANASASIIDYDYQNQDNALATEIPGTTDIPESVTNWTPIFTWTANYYALTHIAINASVEIVKLFESRIVEFALYNPNTDTTYCMATFEAGVDSQSPNFSSLGCTYTATIEEGTTIEVRAAATADAFIISKDHGLGATFSVMQFSMRRPKYHHYNPHDHYGPHVKHGTSYSTMAMAGDDNMTEAMMGDGEF